MKNELKSWLIAGVVLLAIMGLLGYLPGMGLLGSVRDDYIPMAPGTAICFLILAISLITLNVKNISASSLIIPLILSLFVSLYGLLDVAGYLFGKDLVFEDTLVPYAGHLHGIPIARMSPVTGALLFLSGAAIFFII
ncbi:MAG TPA: PAS domain-containing sensor histidine kinase, partial [Gammaproteobacteria bacterium]|nr:PAS domain-containing sensor histidine kinase [Gammaproteobacteria bacterium]